MKNLIEIAKQILALNPNASLTGTLMLKLRGIDLGREPHDIDILICDHAPAIVFPESWVLVEKGISSDGCSAKYEYNGIIIDVLSHGEKPDIIDGIQVGKLQSLLDAKYRYSLQGNSEAQKHHDDLVMIGYKFPEISLEPIDLNDLF